MKSSIGSYVILFLLGLGFAYWADMDPSISSDSEALWENALAKDFTGLKFETENSESLKVDKVGDGAYWAVENTKDAQEFKVRKDFSRVIEFWSKLKVRRVVGSASEVNLEDFGLSESAKKLTLIYGEKNFKYLVGKQAFQSQQYFILDKARDQVALIDRAGVQALEAPKSQIFERDFFAVKLEDIDEIKISMSDKELFLQTKGRGADGKLIWARKDEESNQSLSNWLDRVSSLQIKSYIPLAEKDSKASLPVSLSIEFFKDSKKIESLVIKSLQTQKSSYVLRSELSYGYFKTIDVRIEGLLKDLEGLL